MSRSENRNNPQTEADALAQYIKDLDTIKRLVDDLVFTPEEADRIVSGLTRELTDKFPPPKYPVQVDEL